MQERLTIETFVYDNGRKIHFSRIQKPVTATVPPRAVQLYQLSSELVRVIGAAPDEEHDYLAIVEGTVGEGEEVRMTKLPFNPQFLDGASYSLQGTLNLLAVRVRNSLNHQRREVARSNPLK